MLFISYAKNFFVPPAQFGIGSASPIRTFPDALQASLPSRNTVAFINNGFTGGDIERVIDQLSRQVQSSGKQVQLLQRDSDLLTTCRSSLRGVTQCYGAVSFHASPTEGAGRHWNYTLRNDGALGSKIYVDHKTNDVQLYVLPFQRAVDSAIASVSGFRPLPNDIEEYPYTDKNQEERDRNITEQYQGTLISIIALAFFVGIVGVTYQLVGHMAMERELGMSQLIEAMMPNKRRWEPQAARLLASHFAFDIIYIPGWIVMGAIVAGLVFPQANAGMVIAIHLLIGFALTSYSIFFGALFRKAQLSGITTTLVSLILAIIAQIALGAHGSTGAVIVLSLLFPPMTYTLFLIYGAGFQQHSNPINLSKYSPATDWQVTGGTFIALMIVQILVFPFLAAFVERFLYGTASRTRRLTADDPSIAVKMDSFSKIYIPGFFKRLLLRCRRRRDEDRVVAVNDLSLHVRSGQIMVLLGANGSGKSTTLDAIAGLNTVSQGSIELDGTGGLGLCPQKNVLWDELTVQEHVKIFDRLKTKGLKALESEIEGLVSACDLDVKLKAKAKTLSGGQKRKLQLAMMLTGGSKVCCVDEVSSGIDPLARRKVWDILLRERGKRTILLTTHFLDEADVLSDHIAVLSKGNLKAEGSAVELKHRLGGGYRLCVRADTKVVLDPIFDNVKTHMDYDLRVYQLNTSEDLARFINVLEHQAVHDYRVQGPTVEDVFLALAEEVKEDLHPEDAMVEKPMSRSSQLDGCSDSSDRASEKEVLDLYTGQGTGLLQQSWILFRKRFTVLRHNYFPHLIAVLIPIIAAGLVTLFLKGFEPISCTPKQNQGYAPNSTQSDLFSDADVVFGPPRAVPTRAIQAIYPALNKTSTHTANTIDEMNTYIAQNYHNVTPGGFFVSQANPSPLLAYVANYGVVSASIVQNALDNILTGSVIGTVYQPIEIPWAPGTGKTLQLILYFGLAMSAYPGFFALYPTGERLRKVRALHYSNGIRSGPLWSAYTTFDFLGVILTSAVAVIIFVAQWSGWYYPG